MKEFMPNNWVHLTLAIRMRRMEQFEDWRKKLGSPREKIIYEYSQNKYVYLGSMLCIFIAGVSIMITKPIKNPYLIIIIIWNSILYFGIGIILRKTYIKELPNDTKIIEEIDKKGELENFITYLESKLTPYNICEFLPANKIVNFNLNIIFSTSFSIFLLAIQLFYKSKSNIYIQINAILWSLVISLYVFLGEKIYRLIKPNDTMITIWALKCIKKYNNKRS
ncbi:hypothetical protein [Desulfonauticus submarinus]